MIFVDDELVTFTEYPNGETCVPWDLSAKQGDRVRLRWESDRDLVRLALVRECFPHAPELEIEYMPYSRMDRSVNGSCYSLRAVASLINAMDWKQVIVWEPHSDKTLQELARAVPYWVTASMLKHVRTAIGFRADMGDWIVLPDMGALSRYEHHVGKDRIVLSKERDFESGKITGLRLSSANTEKVRDLGRWPSWRGRNALIIDDLSSRGGTFIQAKRVLEPLGFTHFYLLVTHLEPVAYESTLLDEFDGVFASTSMPAPREHPKVHIFQKEDWL